MADGINTKFVKNYQTAEYGKFVELTDNRFPPISVIRSSFPDQSNAFPNNIGAPPLTSVEIYPKYGILTYVTNFTDMPIVLSAADVQIGGVEIKDWDSDLRADVTSSDGLNALRVLSQDLESTVDDVTIGDKQGNFATIHLTYSALNVYPVVPSGGYTLCESRTSGNPSFVSKQIVIHNNSNDDVNVTLTLTSGMSCLIPVGKNSTSNHIMILNLAVSAVNIYNGTAITFFA